MNLKIIALVGLGTLLVAGVAGAQLMRSSYNEPKHDVVIEDGAFQIRDYAPRIVAETRVSSSDWRQSTSVGFNRLAGFIFGKNRTETGESTKIAMTTPVEASMGDESQIVVFTMPPEWTMEDLPNPDDPNVTIREVPETTVASFRFSGTARSQDLEPMKAKLMEWVKKEGYEAVSEVKIAQYDPPWVAGPLRRNELMVDVKK